MTAGQALERQPAATQHAVGHYGLYGIGGTGRVIAAGWGQHGRDAALVHAYGKYAEGAQHAAHGRPANAEEPDWCRAARRSNGKSSAATQA